MRRAIPSVVIDRSRKRRPVPRDPADQEHVAAHATDSDAVMDVRSALRQLAPRARACTVLRFYDDLTVSQIAAHLGLADGTVKRYLSDASAKLAHTRSGRMRSCGAIAHGRIAHSGVAFAF